VTTPPALVHTVTLAQAAKALQVHEVTVRRLIATKQIYAKKIGQQWRIPVESLNAFITGEKPADKPNSKTISKPAHNATVTAPITAPNNSGPLKEWKIGKGKPERRERTT